MSDCENPTAPADRASVLAMRLRGRTVQQIADVTGKPVLLVKEILRAAGWPDQLKTAGTLARLGGPSVATAARSDSVSELSAMCDQAGTRRTQTLKARLARTQAEILEDAAKRQARQERRNQVEVLEGKVAELNGRIAALKGAGA